MEDLLGKAFATAFRAHEGHVDKSGEVYATHLVRVAAMVDGDTARAVALLHDTVEDTNLTEADIRSEFPPEIAEAVMALTKRADEPLEDYIARVAENPLARRVKIADITDNSAPSRMAKLPSEMQARLKIKYSKALALLDAEAS
ncbi:MAG: HD domain-containing protein [Pseudomonadota bacterium]